MAKGICENIGQVCSAPDGVDCKGAGFMRVRVIMDITQPLRRGRIISLGKNKEYRMFLKYEWLPNLCYWCGCLTHSDRNCDVWLDSEGALIVEQQAYGSWIRALVFSKA